MTNKLKATWFLICCIAFHTSKAFAYTTEQYSWNSVVLGGGGAVIGIVVHPTEPGLIYIRTDNGGACRWDPVNKGWIFITGGFSVDEKNLIGVQGVAIDPLNPEVVYLCCGSYASRTPSDVYKSNDRGKTFTKTNLNKAFQAGRCKEELNILNQEREKRLKELG